MDLGGGLAASVGNDAVVGASVIEANGFAGSPKEVDDRGAAKGEGVEGDRDIVARRGVEKKEDV